MKSSRALRKRKQKLQARLDRKPFGTGGPVFGSGSRRYEVSDRTDATGFGGIGLMQEVVLKVGLADLVNKRLQLLKYAHPYHESDHVLNLIYNFTTGATCLDDLEELRNDSAYLNALGVRRIPDPTTAGDFLRRFGHDDNLMLLSVMNEANRRVWRAANTSRQFAILDVDSTITETFGEQKRRMDISYKGIWGFHPLVITEATSSTHVCLVHRPGNETSQQDAAYWIEYAVSEVEESFAGVYLRGDSAFNLTHKYDEWDSAGIKFCFGMGSSPNLLKIAGELRESCWKRLSPDHRSSGRPQTPKEGRVKARRFKNIRTNAEHVAEFTYTPSRCTEEYRVIVVRKQIQVSEGHGRLFDEDHYRYFFYITNIRNWTPTEVSEFIRKRCDHENKLEQLKKAAMRFPCADFNANWAWMIMGAMAWNLKSWLGMIFDDPAAGRDIIAMEFKRFLRGIIYVPCQILKTGRQIVFRFLNMTPWLESVLKTIQKLRAGPNFI